MTTDTRPPAVDLAYSIDDFTPSPDRDSQYLYRAIEDTMLDLATEVPGGRVLDMACGTGKNAMRIAERGCYSVGAEASMEMIGVGRWVHPASSARMVRSIAEEIPFASGAFDRVICQGSLDHFADAHAFMREAARVIKPEGRVVIALANFESVSCRIGRAVDRVKRRLGRPRPPWRLYWQTPEDHNVKGDLPYVRSLGADALVLDRMFGISLFWPVPGYGKALNLMPDAIAFRLWRAFDGIARKRPQDADMIVSVWKRHDSP